MRFVRTSALFCLSLILIVTPSVQAKPKKSDPLKIEVKKIRSRFGEFKAALEFWVKTALSKGKQRLSRYRILAFDELKSGFFTAHVYDYGKDELVRIEGKIPSPRDGAFWASAKTRWSVSSVDKGKAPIPPTSEEIQAATNLVRKSLGHKAGLYDVVPAMPGTLNAAAISKSNASGTATTVRADGLKGTQLSTNERVLAISLKPKSGSGQKQEIVGASLSSDQVVHYKYAAPPTTVASAADAEEAIKALSKQDEPRMKFARSDRDNGTCGLEEDMDSSSPPRGTPGSATITVKRPNGDVLWQLDVIRPTASSGYWGSGIELRNVYYKGKRILKRANVPIFNVQYLGNACGPYRDWAFEENRFQAKVDQVLIGDENSGIALTSEVPKSILQSGTDIGNYYGVAVYTDKDDQTGLLKTTLLSEMAAGWYRYVSMWELFEDGSIKPQFGFGAVENACVCNRHFHHAYWRLEFDLGGSPATPEGKAINKFEKKLAGSWRASEFQETFTRDGRTDYRVTGQNGMAYQIVPGPRDGTATQAKQPDETADRFGKSDIWVMNAKDEQLDDHILGSNDDDEPGEAIKISQFLKADPGEPTNDRLDNQSVVVWYGAHFVHDVVGEQAAGATPEPNEGQNSHIVGPTLKPVRQ